MTDPLETPEGQRIVEAMVRACNFDEPFLDTDTESTWYARVMLRAALSVTGECAMCSGTRRIDVPASKTSAGRYAASQTVALSCDCLDCIDGTEPLLVLREQS